jgi:hypothetical protein
MKYIVLVIPFIIGVIGITIFNKQVRDARGIQ